MRAPVPSLAAVLILAGLRAVPCIAQPGANDPTFNPSDTGFGNGTAFNGDLSDLVMQPDAKVVAVGDFTEFDGVPRNHIARLDVFGALDESFVPAMGVGGGSIIAVALQSDGKVLVGGVFTFPGNRIARLHADGSLDGTFQTGTGFNGEVDRITVQMDGKILVGGGFTSYSGVSCGHIARLNVDGSLDTSFNTGIGFTGYNAPRIESIVVQPNGKILAGGSFDAFNGINRYGIVRLANDGSLDPSFAIEFGLFPVVNSFALRPDGKLVVGGNGNVVRRLNTDGTNDLGFTAAFFGGGLYSVALQPDGKILVGGNFGSPNGYDRNFTRLNEEGTLDLLFDTGVGFDRWVKPILVQPDGNLIVGGSFRSIAGWGRNHMARLGANGSLDQNFLPNGTGANDEVSVMVLRPDGRMVVGGSFTAYNGVGSNYLIQLDGEGNVDPTFNIGTGFDQPFITGIADLVLQADGKLVAAGTFQYFNGSVRHGILRLNVDGSLDATFTIGTGFDQYVSSIALQSDGKILVGGGFTSFNGTARSRIARLNPNGTLDASFDPGTGFDEWVGSIAVQPDGRIIAGGSFTSFNGLAAPRILRLNSNATLDTSFDPGSGFNDFVGSLNLLTNGSVLAAGGFNTFNGTARDHLAILGSNGALDASFNTGGGFSGNASSVRTVVVQPNGRIIAGGWFTAYQGVGRNRIVRLFANGEIDMSFDPGAGFNVVWPYSGVASMVLQPDGRILAGGAFTAFNGIGRNHIARLWGDCVVGASCDDGLATTGPDSFDANCFCTGPVVDCVGVPNGPVMPGTACDDGASATGNDVYGVDCVCAGQLVDCFGVIGGPALPGSVCNDGDIATWGDVYSADCVCVGLLLDCMGLAGGSALPGSGCNDGVVTTGPDSWGTDCICTGPAIDCLGVPNGTALPGTPCDDGFPGTANDTYNAFCICTGEAVCLPAQLTTTADPVVSCGAVNLKFNGTSTIAATEVPGANKYQFRLTNTAGQPAYARTIAFPTRSFTLTPWYTKPLKAGRTYNVQVHASFDDGATWCDYGPSCTVKISWTPLAPFTEPRGYEAEYTEEPTELLLYPNPTNGDQVRIQLSGIDPELSNATLDITDLFGKRVMSAILPLQDGGLDAMLILHSGIADGLYIVTIVTGEQRFIERLMIQR